MLTQTTGTVPRDLIRIQFIISVLFFTEISAILFHDITFKMRTKDIIHGLVLRQDRFYNISNSSEMVKWYEAFKFKLESRVIQLEYYTNVLIS